MNLPRSAPPFATAALLAVVFSLPAASRVAAQTACAAGVAPEVVERIRHRLEAARATGHLSAGNDRLLARRALPEFYEARGFGPAWIDGAGMSACGGRMVANLRTVEADGLDGADYHRAEIEAAVRAVRDDPSPAALADLDLLLTDAYLVVGSHLLQGRVNPVTLEAEWLANRRDADMAAHLRGTLEAGDVDGRLAALRPRQPEYGALRDRLAHLRDVAERGGWPTVPSGATLHPGDADGRVPALRIRLHASGDLAVAAPPADPALFDPALAEAVRVFQRRHGLTDDADVGPATLAAMAVPVAERIRQVSVNLERWRWLPDDLGRRHIRVNIADFRMEVREAGETTLSMRAVVGRQYRQTPMFSSVMTYLVLAPYWHVPPTIAAVDKLPEIKRDPGYLAAQRMTLLDATGNAPVDPHSVDWATMTGTELNRRFRIRQDPGPWNALGNVKFMFPNRHNVYLHDTPSRELFSRTERAFSSGCIRLENPLELADHLLAGDQNWTPTRIRSTVAAGVEATVRLREGIPVHLLYWTAFVDDEGTIHFRNDLYGRDRTVLQALLDDPPGP